MSLLSDRDIQALCQGDRSMITPFQEKTIEKGVISYGLSSYGYDVRLGDTLKVIRSTEGYRSDRPFLDPKDPDSLTDKFITHVVPLGRPFLLEPHSFALGSTVETFRIPRDIMVTCLGKSTYARVGLTVIVTPIEPEFEGTVVIELINPTNYPVYVYSGEGIAQFLFHRSLSPCRESYRDKGGKYQHQTGITHARIKPSDKS